MKAQRIPLRDFPDHQPLKWEARLANYGLSMDAGTEIPSKPRPQRRSGTAVNQDQPPIPCPPGKRVYACTACGHQQVLAPNDFIPGQPAPTCHECHGTIRRLKAPPEPSTAPTMTRTPTQCNTNEPCPF